MNMPAFGFNAPVTNNVPAAVAAPVAAQPVYGTGLPAELMGLQTAQVFDGVKPKIPPGDYRVRIVKCLLKNTQDYGNAFIAEYVVVSSDNGVPPGTEGSIFKGTGTKQISYLANWFCDVLGVSRSDTAQVRQVQQCLPYIANAAITGVATQYPGTDQKAEPSLLIGPEFSLKVRDSGKTSNKTGKPVYDEYWSRAA